jgi:hypothetical protein
MDNKEIVGKGPEYVHVAQGSEACSFEHGSELSVSTKCPKFFFLVSERVLASEKGLYLVSRFMIKHFIQRNHFSTCNRFVCRNIG